jgi:hypothetical protein
MAEASYSQQHLKKSAKNAANGPELEKLRRTKSDFKEFLDAIVMNRKNVASPGVSNEPVPRHAKVDPVQFGECETAKCPKGRSGTSKDSKRAHERRGSAGTLGVVPQKSPSGYLLDESSANQMDDINLKQASMWNNKDFLRYCDEFQKYFMKKLEVMNSAGRLKPEPSLSRIGQSRYQQPDTPSEYVRRH